MNQDPFKEYIRETEPDKRDKEYAWRTAIGLQAVDGLETSEYLAQTAVRNIRGEISFEEDKLNNCSAEDIKKQNPAMPELKKTRTSPHGWELIPEARLQNLSCLEKTERSWIRFTRRMKVRPLRLPAVRSLI